MSVRSTFRSLVWVLAEGAHMVLDVGECLMNWYAPLPPPYVQMPLVAHGEPLSPLADDDVSRECSADQPVSSTPATANDENPVPGYGISTRSLGRRPR
jgi:hypothetical protein